MLSSLFIFTFIFTFTDMATCQLYLLSTILILSLNRASSYFINEEFTPRFEELKRSPDAYGIIRSFKKTDPSWRYIGLGKRVVNYVGEHVYENRPYARIVFGRNQTPYSIL
ncbi:hypothetical protein AB6A40_007606 [Gnathostoma spinigerum]|uniref:Uncharacterized protein n=1 Tax=Gnathostoma spinigerum TaxID=75299 RepID=A0ABD6EW42_9BILA